MKCQHCKTTKNLYINSYKTNGKPSYICRICNTERAKKYRATKNGAEKIREALYRSAKKYRKKQNARALVQYHIKKGNIVRPKYCDKCLKRGEIHAHHNNYNMPLDISWFCRNCHVQLHKTLV